MTALVPRAGGAPPPASLSATALRARFRALPAAIRSTDYLVVGGGRRFRAVQRRRLRSSSRVSVLVVAAFNVLDATYLVGLGTASVGPAIAFDMVVMLAALTAWWQLPRRLYHHPEATASVIMLGVAITTVGSATFTSHLAVQTVGYLLLLPTLIALALPWRTIVHLRWLSAFTFVAATYLLVGARASPRASWRI